MNAGLRYYPEELGFVFQKNSDDGNCFRNGHRPVKLLARAPPSLRFVIKQNETLASIKYVAIIGRP